MSNHQHGRLFELQFDQLLDLLLGDYVDVGSGLIQHHQLTLPENSPADTEELLLARAEVAAVLLYLQVNATSLDQVVQASFLKQAHDLYIGHLIEGVQVEPKRTLKHRGILGNHGYLGSHISQVKLGNVLTVQEDLPAKKLHNSADRQANCALSCTRPSDNTHLLSWLDGERKAFEDQLGGGPVSQLDISEFQFTLAGPVLILDLEDLRGDLWHFVFLGNFQNLEESIDGDHLAFDHLKHADDSRQVKVELQGVVDQERKQDRIRVPPPEDRESADDRRDREYKQVESNIEPEGNAVAVEVGQDVVVEELAIPLQVSSLALEGPDSRGSVERLL